MASPDVGEEPERVLHVGQQAHASAIMSSSGLANSENVKTSSLSGQPPGPFTELQR